MLSDDVNAGVGVYSGTLTFGPNQISNAIAEENITKYKVYLADSTGAKVGSVLGSVDVASAETGTVCCDSDKYSVAIQGAATTASASDIMVVVVDSNNNEMPTGVKQPIADAKGCPTYAEMFVTQSATSSCSGALPTAGALPVPTTAQASSTCTKCPYAQTVTGADSVSNGGAKVTTTAVTGQCIEATTAPTLTCPAGTNPLTTGSYPKIKCHVCGHPVLSADTDDRAGYFTGSIKFGQNQMGGSIAEGSIDSYKVYLVDRDLNKLAEAGQVTKSGSGSCCEKDRYSVSFTGLSLPGGTVGMTVNPVETTKQVVPMGKYVPLVDAVATTTTAAAVTSSTPSTPQTTSTQMPPGPKDTVIAGTMSMTVNDATAFAADPSAALAVKKGIADVTRVPEKWVTVNITATRRLSEEEEEERRLSGSVSILYEIMVPSSAPQSNVNSVTDVLSNSTAPSLLTTAITTQVDQVIGAGQYSVNVDSVPAPSLSYIRVTTTKAPKGGSSATTGATGTVGSAGGLRSGSLALYVLLGAMAARSTALSQP